MGNVPTIHNLEKIEDGSSLPDPKQCYEYQPTSDENVFQRKKRTCSDETKSIELDQYQFPCKSNGLCRISVNRNNEVGTTVEVSGQKGGSKVLPEFVHTGAIQMVSEVIGSHCLVCLSKKAEVRAPTCGHLIMCIGCFWDQLTEKQKIYSENELIVITCPICRALMFTPWIIPVKKTSMPVLSYDTVPFLAAVMKNFNEHYLDRTTGSDARPNKTSIQYDQSYDFYSASSHDKLTALDAADNDIKNYLKRQQFRSNRLQIVQTTTQRRPQSPEPSWRRQRTRPANQQPFRV